MSANHTAPTSPFVALACFTILNIVRSGLSLVLLPLYLLYLAPSEYGVLAAVTVVAGIFGLTANLKLDAAMRTFYFDHRHDAAALTEYLRQIFSASVYSVGLFYVVMLLAGDGVFRFLFSHEEIRFFPAGALALAGAGVHACLSCYFVYLRNSLLLRELVAWQVALVAGSVAFQLLFVAGFHLGLYGVLWGALLPSALTMLALCIVRPWLLGATPSRRVLAPSLGYAWPLVALGICYALGTRLDRLVLERYVALEDLGAYALLVGLFGLLALVLDALNNTIRPHLYSAPRVAGSLSASAEAASRAPPSGSRHRAIHAYQVPYLLAGLLTLSGAVFLGAHLHLVTSDPAYLAAQKWLPLGATAFVPMILTRYYALFYEIHKRSMDLSLASIGRLLVLGLLLVSWVPPFGVRGAMAALFAAETLSAVLFGLIAWRKFAVRTPVRILGTLGTYFAVIWSLGYAVAEDSIATFGTLQLAALATALLIMNYRALRALLNGHTFRPAL